MVRKVRKILVEAIALRRADFPQISIFEKSWSNAGMPFGPKMPRWTLTCSL